MKENFDSLQDEILYILNMSDKPLSGAQIMAQSNMADDERQVSNALYRLKAEGKISAPDRNGTRLLYRAVGPLEKSVTEAIDAVATPAPDNRIEELMHNGLPGPQPYVAANLAGDAISSADDGEPFDNSITLRPPVWWMCRDGSLRIETGDRIVSMDLGINDAADLAEMIIAVHESLGIR